MNSSGTLKKRKKRNIAKVGGLAMAPMEDKADKVNWRTPYTTLEEDNNHFISSATKTDTRLRMSAILRESRQSSGGGRSHYGRVTRNPMFHQELEGMEDTLSDDTTPPTPLFPGGVGAGKYESDRPNLLDKTIMNRLRLLVLVGAASGSFPWYWDKKKRRIEKAGPELEKLWRIIWFVVAAQTFFLTLFQGYSFSLRVADRTNMTNRAVAMNMYGVLWYMYLDLFNINMHLYRERIRKYINTMLELNEKYVEKYVVNLDEAEPDGRLVMNISIPSNLSQIIVCIVLYLAMPNMPWFLMSYIYPKPWYWLIPGAIQEFVFVGQVITSYLIISWVSVGHAYSVEFWLKETHSHNDSGMTLDSLRHPKAAVEVYRALQVLSANFNDCMSPLAIPLMKIISLSALIPTGYILIRSMNHLFIDEFPGILTYPISVIDCAFAPYTIMSMSAEMYDIASSFIESWSRTKSKDFRRILMSCPALNVKVGKFYRITVETTITYFKVIFDFITDAIITFP